MPSQGEIFDKPRQATKLPGDGYAATPGSGPKGETCKSCGHLRRHAAGDRKWNKCGLIKRHWQRSTDIRLDAPACLHWIKRLLDQTDER